MKKRVRSTPGMQCSWIFAVLITLAVAGCQSKQIEQAYLPRVSTVKNDAGLVRVSWPSRTGYRYRLFATDEQGNVVPYKKQLFIGTGGMIEFEFNLDPRRPLPVYSVVPEKIPGD